MSNFNIIIIINKVLIKVTLNKVIAGALYIVIYGWNALFHQQVIEKEEKKQN